MGNAQQEDTWAAGDSYEYFMGRWSRLVALEFLRWLELPAGLEWLDAGCGTGALTQTILGHAGPQSVTGVDPSPTFIEHLKKSFKAGKVRFEVGELESLPIKSSSIDAVVAGLVLNFVARPLDGVAELTRVTRSKGVIAVYVWDYAGKMELLRHFWNAATSLDPTAYPLDEGRRFPLCQPEPLARLFAQAGLGEVAVRSIDVPTIFRDFDDFWLPFLGGQGPAPGYVMTLDEARRNTLRDRIRSALPITDDGSISLVARAWAIRGRKP